MINFRFELKHPFYHTNDKQIDYFEFDKSISKNKALSIQVSDFKVGMLIFFEFVWHIKRDHAGLELSIGILGKELIINLYDKRHWNYEEDRWDE